MTKQITGAIAVAALLGQPMLASADWTDDWMMDVRFNYALMSDPGGTDQDVGDGSHIVTFNGDGIEGSSGLGFAIGKRFDSVGVSLVYEQMGMEYDLTGSVEADGDVLRTSTGDFDAETWMIEVDYTVDISENWEWTMLFGLGQTTFDFGANSATISPAAGGTFIVGDASDNSDTSTRLGVGIGYKLSEGATLLTMLQYTNYGSADLKITDGQTTTTSLDSEATELSVRLRFDF